MSAGALPAASAPAPANRSLVSLPMHATLILTHSFGSTDRPSARGDNGDPGGRFDPLAKTC
jgi:hypothetical protein